MKRCRIDPMPEFTPDTTEAVWKVLRGLNHGMRVEIEPGILLDAKTVRNLRRAHVTWPLGLRLIVRDEADRPESVVRVARRE
jgi:hypothetical protein